MVASGAALDGHVLVLNKHYAAVRVVSVRRAFSMLYRRLVEVVHCENDRWETHDFDSWRDLSLYRAKYQREHHEWIHCVRFDLAVPRIVRLVLYDRLPRQSVKLNRRNIFARDHGRCQYCGRSFPTSELSLDHVVPRSQGGGTTWENLVCACVKCNVRKGGRQPHEAGIRLITKPVRPRRPPVITLRLSSSKYASWKQFLDEAYWSVELRDE